MNNLTANIFPFLIFDRCKLNLDHYENIWDQVTIKLIFKGDECCFVRCTSESSERFHISEYKDA